jgi:hypothetical protein
VKQLHSTVTQELKMKMTIVVLVLCTFAQGAQAKGPVCRDIPAPSDRLACYDLASPPKSTPSVAKSNDASRPPYSDPFIAEDAKTTAKLKTICRGC